MTHPYSYKVMRSFTHDPSFDVIVKVLQQTFTSITLAFGDDAAKLKVQNNNDNNNNNQQQHYSGMSSKGKTIIQMFKCLISMPGLFTTPKNTN
eukprot:UN10311